MARENRLEGVIAPVVTPFDADGTPNTERFIAHSQWLLEDGCNALAPFGTTSEANSIGIDERMGLLEAMVDAGIDPAELMPGTGTCSIADTVMLTQHATDLGCAGVLMLPPFYYPNPTDEGLYRYFSEVIEETADNDLAVYLYHIPQMTGVPFSLELIERLRNAYPDTVVGLKDSSGNWDNMKAILDRFEDFDVFPGTETYLHDGLQNGGAGVISAVANINAKKMREVYDCNDPDEAARLQQGVTAFRKDVQSYPLIPVLKAIVAHYRRDPAWMDVRPPLETMSGADASRAIEQLAADHGFRLSFDLEA
jgi:4-hydroxy-tetrahydrodipicolinate synthase